MEWYEVRVDYEKVAAFSPINKEALKKARDLIDATRFDLYRDKVLQIVLCSRQVSYIPWAELGFVDEKLIHEEHPTVLEIESLLTN